MQPARLDTAHRSLCTGFWPEAMAGTPCTDCPVVHPCLCTYRGQWGPNATTWLLPAELAPTELRSMCHGFSAAVGKAGALVAGVVVLGLVPSCLSRLSEVATTAMALATTGVS